MLKLIATDMDGTLLNDKKEMPARTFDVVAKLHAKDIVFAVASGRQHHSLQKLYGDIKDDIVIVGANGAIIIDRGNVLRIEPLDKATVKSIVKKLESLPHLKLTLCGVATDYMFENNVMGVLDDYLVESHFPVRQLISDFSDIPADEDIIQISVYDEEHQSKTNIYDALSDFHEKCHMTISGSEWVDIIATGVNKGTAIKQLQDIYDATYEETMVFGDERNDYEMMQTGYYSFAMENAVDLIKDVSNFRAPSNESEGVLAIIDNFLSMVK